MQTMEDLARKVEECQLQRAAREEENTLLRGQLAGAKDANALLRERVAYLEEQIENAQSETTAALASADEFRAKAFAARGAVKERDELLTKLDARRGEASLHLQAIAELRSLVAAFLADHARGSLPETRLCECECCVRARVVVGEVAS